MTAFDHVSSSPPVLMKEKHYTPPSSRPCLCISKISRANVQVGSEVTCHLTLKKAGSDGVFTLLMGRN